LEELVHLCSKSKKSTSRWSPPQHHGIYLNHQVNIFHWFGIRACWFIYKNQPTVAGAALAFDQVPKRFLYSKTHRFKYDIQRSKDNTMLYLTESNAFYYLLKLIED